MKPGSHFGDRRASSSAGSPPRLSDDQLAQLRETLEALGDIPREPRLSRGDLRLKIVMVDVDGAIVAIWGRRASPGRRDC